MMFIYESLCDLSKKEIDSEIEKAIKQMVIKSGGFSYSDDVFHRVIYGVILLNKKIGELLGNNTQPFFNLKELVVKTRAIKIAYEIEQNRPTFDMVDEYTQLCRELMIEPTIEVLFNCVLVRDLVMYYRDCLEVVNSGTIPKNHLNKIMKKDYGENSDIASFELLVNQFYNK